MSLALRLSIAMILLVVITTAGTGMLIYKRANDASRPVVFESLKARAGILADGVTDYVSGSKEDVMMMADLPAVRATAKLKRTGGTIDGRDYAAWRSQLAAEMLALIKAKHSYAQIRLIGLDDDGRELVRVQRNLSTDATMIVPDRDLQSKGGRDYFRDAVSMPVGALYVSQVSYNREQGRIELPAWPTLRLATAIHDDNDVPLGLVVINLHLEELFTQLPKGGFRGGEVYLLDENGYYLISPNPEQAFAFEYGNASTFQSDWPGIASLVNTPMPVGGRTRDADGREYAVSAWPIQLSEQRHLTLIEAVPTEIVFRGAATVARSATMTGAVAVVLAGLLAIAIAATLTDPLRAITRAVGAASEGKPATLPVNATGEPGELARAVSRYLERDSLLNAIAGTSVDSIVTVDMNGLITTWNPAAERLYGYAAREAIGQSINILTPIDRRGEFAELMERISRNESIDVFETVKLTKAGEPIDVSLTVAPIHDSQGNVIGASRIARDITAKLASERRLRRLQAEAAHAARISAAGQMAGALAHEMNQPLTAVVNYARSARRILLKRGVAEDDEVIVYVDRAADQGQRASAIIKRLRQFIGNRQDRIEREDVNAVVEGALETALSDDAGTSLNVVRSYSPDLPTIPLDRVQIQQVVANLIRNAREAMDGSPRQNLSVRTTDHPTYVAVTVADTGPGLSDEVMAHLFEPFATTKRQGMGIGLTISRSIVETHGGHMFVNSDEHGSEFSFTLPKEHA
ncbi:sensor histidine kinase [Pseudohoeflea suaedae]|uniref:histidine kinase n=1 Tax=Pseudohoeflea suaedae TaxID=877384 RepID=A0A4R5PM80_9HYPH|nr:PAS domain-containing sensor histidine kinase [Pseudohoeflea suaedae]TDH37958.1 sensor histidine kinase [Pseudohoeflea suaedae]